MSDASEQILKSFRKFQGAGRAWLDDRPAGQHVDGFDDPPEARLKEIMLTAEGFSLDQITAQGTLHAVKQTLEAMDSEIDLAVQYLGRALEPLADILRYGASAPSSRVDFRGPFGDSGIVNFSLGVISRQGDLSGNMEVVRQALRLVGNSVISHDENRGRVVASNSLKAMIELLKHPKLTPVAMSVLNNVSVDYEPAQQQIAENGIVEALMPILEVAENEQLASMAVTLVELASKHARGADLSPDGILDALVRLALLPDFSIEEFISATKAMHNYLKATRFQEIFVKSGVIENVSQIIRHRNLERFDNESTEDKEELSHVCLALVSVASDCCDLPIFEEKYPIQLENTSHLVSFMRMDDIYVQLLGCILTGNYARSEESCKALIGYDVHETLVKVVLENNDARVLHSALGALKNLAVPLSLREKLAEPDTFAAASRIWDMATIPQVQLVSVSLVRLLITKCLANITTHLLRSRPTSPTAGSDETYLSSLQSLFSKVDSLPIKLEIGRTIAEVLRCLGSAPDIDPQEIEKYYDRLFSRHPGFARPIGTMLTQTQYPPVRSEAFFIFALLARRKEGCSAIQEILEDEAVFKVLVETITGEGGVGTKDRDNAIVMASEMVKNGDQGAFLSMEEVEQLIQGRDVEDVYRELGEKMKRMKV